MQTVDQGKLFQSDAQLKIAEARRQKSLSDHKPSIENGDPLILPSKPLQIIVDGNDAYVAENGFVAQRVDLRSGKIKATFRGHSGPVTSLALFTHTIATKKKRKILFTASWDKSIKIWDVETQVLLSTSTAHVDFVKSIHLIPALRVLVSGSTDRDIRLWSFDALFKSFKWSDIDDQFQNRKKAKIEENQAKSAAQLAQDDAIQDVPVGITNLDGPSLSVRAKWPGAMYGSMACLGVLKSHTRPIDSLNSYPTVELMEKDSLSERKDGALPPHLLVSADSMGALKVWLLHPSSPSENQIKGLLDSTTWPHKTSINDIQIGCEIRHDIDQQISAQLWTASADNCVLCSTLDLLPTSNQRVMKMLKIEQPYFVRCVLNLPLFFSQTESESSYPNWLITGSTDEEIRIYDLEDIEEKSKSNIRSSDKTWRKHDGIHSAEPAGISNGWFACLNAHWHEVNCLKIWIDSDSKEQWLISSSLDGTLRKWQLKELQQRFLLQPKTTSVIKPITSNRPRPSSKNTHQFELTAEEEAELAEMMNET